MTDTTTRNLAREVAEALVNTGKLKREMMQKGHYDELLGNGVLVNYQQDTWITILDGDEIAYEIHPNYPNDLNACAHDLTVLGWEFHLGQNLTRVWWEAKYSNGMESIGAKDENPAVAWCESFLALTAYIRQLEAQLAKGEQS